MTPEEKRKANAARQAKWKAAHREKARELARVQSNTYYANNKEKVQARQQQYRTRTREAHATKVAEWRRANPDKQGAAVHRRRAHKASAFVELTQKEQTLVNTYHNFRAFLSYIYGELFAIDHILPLSKGGLDHPDNYQLITRRENSRKGAKVGYTLPEGAICFRLSFCDEFITESELDAEIAAELESAVDADQPIA